MAVIRIGGDALATDDVKHLHAVFRLVRRLATEEVGAHRQEVERIDFVASFQIAELERTLALASSALVEEACVARVSCIVFANRRRFTPRRVVVVVVVVGGDTELAKLRRDVGTATEAA